jgi:hypothetical protein
MVGTVINMGSVLVPSGLVTESLFSLTVYRVPVLPTVSSLFP